MTEFEISVRQHIVRVLLAWGKAMPDSSLRQSIKTGFGNIDFTAGDLGRHIGQAETAQLISGTNDDTFGIMWALTPDGKIKAQQLK